MEPSPQLIQELRTLVVEKIENKVIHPKDKVRLMNDDHWLRRFLLHHDLDVNDALNMVLETCDWREANKVNEISEFNVNIDYLKEGSLFVHSKDKDGKPLFIFKSKKHIKGQKDFDELKKCVIYWFERVERMSDQLTLFFDMADTGLSNMDMDYTKYLINLCKMYYPYILNYIIIFEMPWILNAAFKIIKTWLPAKAIQKIKFLNKNTLKDYVNSEDALVCWGGDDPYQFVFEPESDSTRHDDSKKKVHFADASPNVEHDKDALVSMNQVDNGLLDSKVIISPSETLYFNADGMEIGASLTFTNNSTSSMAYKVKTTSPEKFRVRPSCGSISPNSSVVIGVVVQPGFTLSNIVRDKFLIMIVPLETTGVSTTEEVIDFWKTVDSKNVEQHRLKCGVSSSPNGELGELRLGTLRSSTVSGSNFSTVLGGSDADNKTGKLLINVNQMNNKLESLHGDVKFLEKLNLLSISLIILVVAAYIFNICLKSPTTCSASGNEEDNLPE